MAFLMVGLGAVLFIAAGVLVRGRARQARVTQDTDAWVQFLREDLSWLVATVEVTSSRSSSPY